jgi:hypothetical protein
MCRRGGVGSIGMVDGGVVEDVRVSNDWKTWLWPKG